jgi:nitroreductase
MSMTQQLDRGPAFASVMKERRSVRKYDPSFTISQEEMKELLGEAMLAPSSANMQPWRFLVIDSAEEKQRLLPIANNQQQVVEASAVIALLVDLENYKLADTIYSRAVEAGYMSEEVKTSFVSRIVGMYAGLPPEVVHKINYIDGGIIAMQLMLAAKARGYDTVPMGGYKVDQFVEAYEISDRYAPVMLIAVGKAVGVGHPTVRLTVDEVTSWNKMSL